MRFHGNNFIIETLWFRRMEMVHCAVAGRLVTPWF
jgi:hypothetical protein